MKLQSDYAILDVKHGRKQLTKRFGPTKPPAKIPVVITGYIDGIFGNDDGVSREFNVTVEKLEVQGK
jgi:hypothetical protein